MASGENVRGAKFIGMQNRMNENKSVLSLNKLSVGFLASILIWIRAFDERKFQFCLVQLFRMCHIRYLAVFVTSSNFALVTCNEKYVFYLLDYKI